MENQDHNPLLSLLERISYRQIKDLIFEQHLAQENYRFYYALDNHDIHKYCFPGNLEGREFERDNMGKIKYDLESDRITAYEDFFTGINIDKPCFFLDEYISELTGLRDQILYRVETGVKLFNYAETFNAYLRGYDPATSPAQTDFTLFISIATGLLKTGAQRYNAVLYNPYFITKPEDLDDLELENKTLLREAFRNSLDVDQGLVGIILQKFAERGAKLTKFSKRLDSEAIARMIGVNKFLTQEFPEEKTLFLFLSSTDSSSEVFYNLASELPMVKNRPFNFHRTVEQVFLSLLIRDLPQEDKLDRLRMAGELIGYREQRQKVDVSLKEYEELEEKVLASFHGLRGKYVNANLARKEQFLTTEQLYKKLEKGPVAVVGQYDTGGSTGNLRKLFRELKQISQQYGGHEINIEYIRKLESAFKISEIFGIIFKKAIQELLQHGQQLKISRGKDPIKATGQHLPIIFRNTGPQSKKMDEIAELYLDQFAFFSASSEKNEVIDKLRELTTTIYDDKFDARSLDEKLVFCLYLLILPDVKVIHGKSNNDHVEAFLLDLANRELPPDNRLLYSDFIYILTWVLRRNENYDDALEWAKKGLEEFPEDARFYHARFLINVCLFPSQYALPLKDIEKAREMYPPLLANKKDVIRRNIDAALLNSEIYASTQVISTKEESREAKRKELEEIREKKLKELKLLTGTTYNDYPEFLHTEAFLELQESENEEDPGKKKEKLEWAMKALDKGTENAKRLIGFDLAVFNSLRTTLIEKKKTISAD